MQKWQARRQAAAAVVLRLSVPCHALLAPACASTTVQYCSSLLNPVPPSLFPLVASVFIMTPSTPKLALFFLLASLLILASQASSSDVEEAPAAAPSAAHIVKDVRECGAACKERCGAHSRPNVCGRACATCCGVCRCVPPGTYGHAELCGKCYTEWKTHGNRTKCP